MKSQIVLLLLLAFVLEKERSVNEELTQEKETKEREELNNSP